MAERRQVEQQEVQPEAPAAMPEEAVTIPPATVPAVALPTGAHGSAEVGGMLDLIGASSPVERRRFVLQLQRTAGNAAVCRWLGVARARHAERHGDDLEAMGGDDE